MKKHLFFSTLVLLLAGCGSGDTKHISTEEPTEPPVTEPEPTEDREAVQRSFLVDKSGLLNSYLYNGRITDLTDVKVIEAPTGFSLNTETGAFEFNSASFTDSDKDVVINYSIGDKLFAYEIDFVPFDSPVVDGYTSINQDADGVKLQTGLSVTPDQTINLHLNASAHLSDKLYITSVTNEIVKVEEVDYQPQTATTESSWKNGFDYKVTARVSLEGLDTGVYYINGQEQVPFVVRNPAKNAKVTVVFPTNTQVAYACSGGKGLYPCQTTPKDSRVSFLRPIRVTEEYNWTWDIIHLIRPFLNWMNSESYYSNSVQYITDADLDNYDEYQESELIVIAAHNEYWTLKAQDNFNKFLDSGKDAFVAGGNIMWWHSRFDDEGRQLVVYKKDPDPDMSANEQSTYLHRLKYEDGSSRAAHHSIGALFSYGGYDNNQWDLTKGPNAMRIIRPNAKIFEGVGLQLCDEIDLSNNHEMDGPLMSGFDVNGFPSVRYDLYTHLHNFEILGYTWGYRGGHTVGTMHAFQRKADSGTTVQFASNGATAFAFTNPSSDKYRKILDNLFGQLVEGKYQFESDTLYQAELKQEMKFPYTGDRIEGIEVCPK